MRKGFVFINVIAVVFVVFAVVGIGSYFLMEKVKAPVAPPPTSETVNSAIDTSTWETYRNEKYGFEVKYPSSFKNPIYETQRREILFQSVSLTKPIENRLIIKLYFYIPENKDLDKLIQFEQFALENEDDMTLGKTLPRVTYSNIVKYNVDGREGRKFDVYTDKELSYTNVYVIHKEYVYKIRYMNALGSSAEELNKIISTFKFFETNDLIQYWKTFRNEGYRFEFRYPQNGKVDEYKIPEDPHTLLFVNIYNDTDLIAELWINDGAKNKNLTDIILGGYNECIALQKNNKIECFKPTFSDFQINGIDILKAGRSYTFKSNLDKDLVFTLNKTGFSEKTVENILSTFKFFEPKSAVLP